MPVEGKAVGSARKKLDLQISTQRAAGGFANSGFK
jgi:hypothetical protein